MVAQERIFVFGASGHAKVIMEAAEVAAIAKVAFLVDDDASLWGGVVYGYPVVGGRESLLAEKTSRSIHAGIVGIGNNIARMRIAAWLKESGIALVTLVHSNALLARGVTVGEGTVILAGVIANPDAAIGKNVIVNTGAVVEHDCVIGDGVHIAPGAVLCGTVSVGEGTLVGAGATVIPNVRIGRNVVVGAGATVVRDVPDDAVVVGTPARILRIGHK